MNIRHFIAPDLSPGQLMINRLHYSRLKSVFSYRPLTGPFFLQSPALYHKPGSINPLIVLYLNKVDAGRSPRQIKAVLIAFDFLVNQ